MKKILILLLVSISFTLPAQRRAPKMAPIYSEGYFVNQRGDTVRGEIQTNVEDATSFYKEFAFKTKRSTKPRVYNTQRAKAYGFDGKDFVMTNYDGKKLFVKRLALGRLGFYEYQFNGKIDGLPAVESVYFVRDTWAESKEKGFSKISNKFYKKSLKPFMAEEKPEIWQQLDKFHFDEQTVVNAINEFNQDFAATAN